MWTGDDIDPDHWSAPDPVARYFINNSEVMEPADLVELYLQLWVARAQDSNNLRFEIEWRGVKTYNANLQFSEADLTTASVTTTDFAQLNPPDINPEVDPILYQTPNLAALINEVRNAPSWPPQGIDKVYFIGIPIPDVTGGASYTRFLGSYHPSTAEQTAALFS